MCDVHLIETSRWQGPAPSSQRCCYCHAPIRGDAVHIAGRLDDGSPGLHHFLYHPDCAWDMEHDDDVIDANQGCFSYGTPISVDAEPDDRRGGVSHGPNATATAVVECERRIA